MSFAQVHTRSVVGLHAPEVMVEVHLSNGLPALTIVGLPEAAVRESKDRVRSAIINSNFQFPNRRLTINLAPADLPKEGARLDLPIAMGILAASGQIEPDWLDDYEFIGELALNGDLRTVAGSLAVARAIKSQSNQQNKAARYKKDENEATAANTKAPMIAAPRKLIVPANNGVEASRVAGVTVYAAATLKAVCEHLRAAHDPSQESKEHLLATVTAKVIPLTANYKVDLADVKGQHHARRALEIAVIVPN